MSWRCQADSLVGIAGRKARVTALRCRRWSCPSCARRLRARMVSLALGGFQTGERVRMMTLTAPGDEDYERSYAELRRRWKRLRERLRRRFPGICFEYFAVTERQDRGHAHLHILFRGGFIPQRWLSQAAALAGFGPIVDVRAVGKEAARYVAKYLGKEMGTTPAALGFPPLPAWHRRATWSRGWVPDWTARRRAWRLAHDLAVFTWYLASGMPLLVSSRLAALGYEVEIADFGDIPPAEQGWERYRQEPLRFQRPGAQHGTCWLCASGDPAARRPHRPAWGRLPPAPPVEEAGPVAP